MPETTKIDGRELVGPENLMKQVWPDPEDRPSLRWLQRQQKARTLPYVKLGHYVWFNVEEVRAALAKKFTVKAR